MKIGLYTDSLGDLAFPDALDWIAAQGIEAVEIGAGNYSRAPHCNLDNLLNDAQARAAFQGAIADHGLIISALNCSGNLIDPHPERRAKAQDTFYKTVRLANLLGLNTIVTMSGCPGDPDGGTYPNWVPFPNTALVEWQWEHGVEPFWKEAGKFAHDHGVRIAIEAAATQVAYNTNTLLRLRQVAGPALGCNFDPSHFLYQSMDPLAIAQALGGDLIFHVHAKDTRINRQQLALNSGFDPSPMTQIADRPWNFRTVGYGHGADWWAELISTLRLLGYDGVFSLEHEDRLISVREGIVKGVEFLKPLLLRTQPEGESH